MFAHRLKFILLPQLIATLNNYACSSCLHWLKSTGLLSLKAFADHVNPQLVKWHNIKGGVQYGCGDLIWLPLSVHVCLGLVVKYWSFVGARTRHSYFELYYLCLNSSLFKLLPPPTPPRAPPAHSLICTGPILMNSMPNINEFHEQNCKKTGENQPLSTCQVSCTKANR